MTILATTKTKIQLLVVQVITALVKEYHVQKDVLKLFKSEIKENLIDGLRSGKIKQEVGKELKELVKIKNYNVGIFSQSLNNDFLIKTYHDRSKNMVGGNKYGFKRKYRWGSKLVKTQLLRKEGSIMLKPEPVTVDGVNFPPRFKRDLTNKHYLNFKASV